MVRGTHQVFPLEINSEMLIQISTVGSFEWSFVPVASRQLFVRVVMVLLILVNGLKCVNDVERTTAVPTLQLHC